MTTPYPHTGTNFRIFFLGNNTVAEYFINSTFNAVDDYHYTQTISYNNPLGRNFQVGDYMEFELGVFLRQPVEGRFNYYSDAWLYRAGYPGLVAWEARARSATPCRSPRARSSAARPRTRGTSRMSPRAP